MASKTGEITARKSLVAVILRWLCVGSGGVHGYVLGASDHFRGMRRLHVGLPRVNLGGG